MKKIFLIFGIGTMSLASFAQGSFNAIKTSQRAGILSTLINPAEMAGMPQKVDIHLFGMDVNVNNSLVSLSSTNTSKFDNPKELFFGNKSDGKPFNATIGIDILGPGVAYAVNKKTTFGLMTRARVMFTMNDIDLNLGKSLLNTSVNDIASGYKINTNSQSFSTLNWFEIGASGATSLLNSDRHSLKIGGTVKAIFSGFYANTYLSQANMNVRVDSANKTAYLSGTGTLGMTYTNPNISDIAGNIMGSPSGFGVDAGISYQYKNVKTGKYIVRAGVALNDIGFTKFTLDQKNNKEYTVTANNVDVSKYISSDLDKVQSELKANGVIQEVNKTETEIEVKLPMAINVYADVNVWKPFFVTLQMQQRASSNDNPRNLMANNYFAITPRIVSRFIEIYTPFTFTENAGNMIGAGMKVGPLYFGSSSIISAVASESQQVDFHFGIRMGFGKNK
jgi:hypothetical protein